MLDVLIVGAGPAGAVAATVLARKGARVRLVDRARFPRDKLCGDTVNPGTLALLRRLGLADRLETRGLPIDGMIVTGADGVAVESALSRRPAGASAGAPRAGLVAAAAGDRRPAPSSSRGRTVRRALVDDRQRRRPAWSSIARPDDSRARRHRRRRPPFDARLRARARAASRPSAPLGDRRVLRKRRPASSAFGEMHVRRGGYIGVAPIPGGLTNVCLVKPWEARPTGAGQRRRHVPRSRGLLLRELARDRGAARALRRRAARHAAGRARSAGGRRAVRTRSTGCCWPATPPGSSIR